jgi:hypothetical protein
MITEIIKVEPTEDQKNLEGDIIWVLVGTRLIIGPFEYFIILVVSALYPDLKVEESETAWKKFDEYVENRGDEFLAAGTFWSSGNIKWWDSHWLNLKSPERHLREILYPAIRDTILNEPRWRRD